MLYPCCVDLCPCQTSMIGWALTGTGHDVDTRAGDAPDLGGSPMSEDLVHDPSAYLFKGLKVDYTDDEWINLHRLPPHHMPRTWPWCME